MLSERRTKMLGDLASRTGKARTSEETFAVSEQVLASADLDLPFILIYVVDADAQRARLVGRTGLPASDDVSPASVDLRAADTPWRLAEVALTGVAQPIDDVASRVAGLTVGPYPELPKTASLPWRLRRRIRPTSCSP